MEDIFLHTPDHIAIDHALRRAEVLSLGGSLELAEAVLATTLGTCFDDAERDELVAISEHLTRCVECRELVSELACGLAEAHTFMPGDLVANRYRIRQLVARGGMGEVYDAEDIELRTRVALKTVRAEIADQKVLEQFKREIFLARKITHPNVCRIFDMGFHGADAERIAFLTMEFLEGETLAERIARGRLTTGEAQPIAEQMVAGLFAAHREGVIHRDFKSHNVMLVSRGAVITDFGLARGVVGGVDDATTEHRGLVGTPAYMAPEQVSGLPLTAAADTYALGVVLFEMVTGRVPFIDKTPLLTAFKRLQEPAPSPRTCVPELDLRWDAAIARCLARAPEARYASIDEVSRALVSSPRVAQRRQWPVALLAAVAVTSVVAIATHKTESSVANVGPTLLPLLPTMRSLPPPRPRMQPDTMPTPPPKTRTDTMPTPLPKNSHPAVAHRVHPAKPRDPELDHFVLKYPD